MRRVVLVLAMVAMALAISATAAFAAIRIGTDGPDNLVGTNEADHLTGKGGEDTLEGLAGNDVYHFADGFGEDTLIEPRKAGDLPGGRDTLSFTGVTIGLDIWMIPQYPRPLYNEVETDGVDDTSRVDLGGSVVEKVVGGSGGDFIHGGQVRNTFKGGAGGQDFLYDYGGRDGTIYLPSLQASDDTYRGFAAGPGFDVVYDYGGTADVLDLRPWKSSDVYLEALDLDTSDPAEETLIISAGDRGVYVFGHFAPWSDVDENGTMEKIIFADRTITSPSAVRSLISSSAGNRSLAPSEAPAPQAAESR